LQGKLAEAERKMSEGEEEAQKKVKGVCRYQKYNCS